MNKTNFYFKNVKKKKFKTKKIFESKVKEDQGINKQKDEICKENERLSNKITMKLNLLKTTNLLINSIINNKNSNKNRANSK